ncbi:lysine transporter LysE [Trinickia dabaoshanensis]|uniref:Lysine transporter LysE n=1 Tax=Trinickia dabaoshanensis TaxID=564714 RepID=A0A2N7VG53_9BURK|nr:LysE family translocator [Trinickia dabaoshanensis]PMS16129.1 lysine transporter LysE [Trinickia dabaoshanensis]
MSDVLSMGAFALAASITPGPVNVVALGAGAQYGLRAGMRHVTGATVGFTLLLLMTGFGLHEFLAHWPMFTKAIQWTGVLFLLYMAYKLAADDGRLGTQRMTKGPSWTSGAAMQWLNPKAWVAALAGMGAYAANGDGRVVAQFAVIYFLICYGSIACWVYAGSRLQRHLREPKQVRFFNRIMALLLTASAIYLIRA